MLRPSPYIPIAMARRSFIFCDICNPQAIREVEMRRASGRAGKGRRVTDGRMWFDGTDEEAKEAGWVASEDGRHICPACFERMRAMRHVLEERLFVTPEVMHLVQDRID
jgi:hypothetical protein